MTLPEVIPIFPLPNVVLFPHMLLPLHVFEPRYRLMTRRVLDADHEFGVVLIERGSEVGGGDVRFDVGTIARVVQAAQLADGGWTLTTVGTRRVRVARWLPEDPFPCAEVAEILESDATAVDHAARERVQRALADVYALMQRIDAGIPDVPALAEDPGRASFEAAIASPLGPLDAQRVLEAAGVSERLAHLETMLAEQTAALRARLEFDE
jgi:Lon protease-like protein